MSFWTWLFTTPGGLLIGIPAFFVIAGLCNTVPDKLRQRKADRVAGRDARLRAEREMWDAIEAREARRRRQAEEAS